MFRCHFFLIFLFPFPLSRFPFLFPVSLLTAAMGEGTQLQVHGLYRSVIGAIFNNVPLLPWEGMPQNPTPHTERERERSTLPPTDPIFPLTPTTQREGPNHFIEYPKIFQNKHPTHVLDPIDKHPTLINNSLSVCFYFSYLNEHFFLIDQDILLKTILFFFGGEFRNEYNQEEEQLTTDSPTYLPSLCTNREQPQEKFKNQDVLKEPTVTSKRKKVEKQKTTLCMST